MSLIALTGSGKVSVWSLSFRRVLIVDDNADLADNIAEILQMDGHVTDIAASAEEAFAKALEGDPEIVVTDFRLPGMSGADFVRRLRTAQIHVRAVVISAFTDDRTMREAKDAGAAFIAKPVDFLLLSKWIGEGSA